MGTQGYDGNSCMDCPLVAHACGRARLTDSSKWEFRAMMTKGPMMTATLVWTRACVCDEQVQLKAV